MYHAVEIDDGRITRIADHANRAEALAAAGLGETDLRAQRAQRAARLSAGCPPGGAVPAENPLPSPGFESSSGLVDGQACIGRVGPRPTRLAPSSSGESIALTRRIPT